VRGPTFSDFFFASLFFGRRLSKKKEVQKPDFTENKAGFGISFKK
jgi:hypothetical protein